MVAPLDVTSREYLSLEFDRQSHPDATPVTAAKDSHRTRLIPRSGWIAQLLNRKIPRPSLVFLIN